ncbi:hypothetical protein Bca4012_052506 [Brassica carinata]
MGDVLLSPLSTTSTSNQLYCGCYSVKKSTCHWSLIYGSVKIESLSLGTTSMCFSKVSSEPDRVGTMALECGLKERENEMSFLDGLELEKPEAGRVNNVYEAERVWRVMITDGLIGTEVTYSLLVSIFVRCGRSELALDTYEMINSNISPKEDQWSLALKIFQCMSKPSLVACNALMNSLGKAGRVGLVFKVYRVAKSLGHKPDEYTWNALLTALYKANRYEDVLQLFDMVRREGLCCLNLNGYLYNRALMSCQKLGWWEKAVKLLYEMEGSRLEVSTSSYNLVISACEKSRQCKVALRVYEHMVGRECRADTFTYLSLVRSCVWGSLWDEAKDILKKVEPDVSLYNAAIHGMCLRREFRFAKELYVEMREMGLEPDGKTRAMMLQNLKRQ